MKISSSIMPQSVRKVVVDATKIVNLTLILGLIGHGIIFWLYDAYVLFYFNCICAINLIFAHSLFKKKQVWPYIVIVVLGIFIFMLLTVVCLGWEYGFQQYCIGFVASLVFLGFLYE